LRVRLMRFEGTMRLPLADVKTSSSVAGCVSFRSVQRVRPSSGLNELAAEIAAQLEQPPGS
jgi:hypothetical protein